MSSFEIRATTPDNEYEINRLIQLFARAYGSRFPLHAVYDMRFWKTGLGSRFTGVGVFEGREMVAHLAIAPDRFDRRLVHLALPACEPELLGSLGELAPGIWSLVERQARKQGWRTVSFPIFSDVKELQLLGVELFGMSEAAILPCYYPLTNLRPATVRQYRSAAAPGRPLSGLRVPLLLALRTIGAADMQAELYAPSVHLEMVRFLYEPFGLQRGFASSSGARSAAGLSADARAIERYYLHKSGVSHAFVQPSLLSGREIQQLDLRTRGQRTSYVYVSLHDPQCPFTCASLEENGFRFCGVLPAYKGRDNIVYFKAAEPVLDRELFSSARARALASYIEDYNLPRALRLLPERARNQGGYAPGARQ